MEPQRFARSLRKKQRRIPTLKSPMVLTRNPRPPHLGNGDTYYAGPNTLDAST